jgi:hypothetical protein
MSKIVPVKISDKLAKVNDNYQIYMYDNGFMFEIGGRSHTDDWVTTKILVNHTSDLLDLINEATILPRD